MRGLIWRAAVVTGAAAVLFGSAVGVASAAGTPTTGTGGVDLSAPGTFLPVVENGQTGRLVALTGVITGTDFEPGVCNAGPANNQPCFQFTNSTPQPGQFERDHNGQTAFANCNPCTVDGKTGSFTFKFTYLNPPNLTTVNFTIQNAAGGLAGLQGQGSLSLTTLQYRLTYFFQ